MDDYIWSASRKLNTLKWVLTGLAESNDQPTKDDIYRLLDMANATERDLRMALHLGKVGAMDNSPRGETDD